MRPRRVLVKSHRWLAIGLMAWLVVIGLTGAWLVEQHQLEAWLHPSRFDATAGDVGPRRAIDAATRTQPKDATVYNVTLPGNGRGVYQVGFEIPSATKGADPGYERVYVDPGTGKVNGAADEEAGFTQWLYRGHMYLWQDHGIFGVFDPQDGWCRKIGGAEPAGVKGVVCDVIPDGQDMVAWFAVGFIAILFTGFYLWYWPGVKRWANAFRVQRRRGPFACNLSLHKAIGFVVWIPLTVIAFTGIAFAFPNLEHWYDNVTPAERDFTLWTPADAENSSVRAKGREPITMDVALQAMQRRFPDRTIHNIAPPADGKGVYTAWVSRGFDPWTREGGAGNAWVFVDQYTGRVTYDGTPSEGNVFDQLWDDWSFPLHTGDWGGPVTRIVWVLIGVSPIVLGATGVTMYVVRRSKRSRRSQPDRHDDPKAVTA
jgi:uncharacterized iron-regulated membrane protein